MSLSRPGKPHWKWGALAQENGLVWFGVSTLIQFMSSAGVKDVDIIAIDMGLRVWGLIKAALSWELNQLWGGSEAKNMISQARQMVSQFAKVRTSSKARADIGFTEGEWGYSVHLCFLTLGPNPSQPNWIIWIFAADQMTFRWRGSKSWITRMNFLTIYIWGFP